MAGINDSATKFKLLVANLPTDVPSQVRDVIMSQPGNFSALATALRDRLAQSRASRLESVLSHQQLGDRTPSQLLRDMRGQLSTAGDLAADRPFLRTLFLQPLPQSARAALSLLAESTPLGDLSEAADRFLEASRPTGAVTAVAEVTAPAPAVRAIAEGTTGLAAAIQGLTAMICRLETSNRRLEEAVYDRRSRSPTPRRESRASSASRREPRTSSSSRTRRDRPDYSWYHRRFGARAHKYTEPCNWSQGGNGTA